MLPGIRGVGGGILYFLDDRLDLAGVWDSEFGKDKSAATGAGLIRIDHVAQTMDYDEMLTWVLFYTSIFDVRRTRRSTLSIRVGSCAARSLKIAAAGCD